MDTITSSVDTSSSYSSSFLDTDTLYQALLAGAIGGLFYGYKPELLKFQSMSSNDVLMKAGACAVSNVLSEYISSEYIVPHLPKGDLRSTEKMISAPLVAGVSNALINKFALKDQRFYGNSVVGAVSDLGAHYGFQAYKKMM